MSTLKNGEHIILESGACITAKFSILLGDRKNSELEIFLNNYNLVTFKTKAFGMKIVTGT